MQRDRISSVADRLLLAALTDVSAAPIVPMAEDKSVSSL
jgi:hypothetical protein